MLTHFCFRMMHLDHMSSGRFGDDDEEEEEKDDGDGSDDDGNNLTRVMVINSNDGDNSDPFQRRVMHRVRGQTEDWQ